MTTVENALDRNDGMKDHASLVEPRLGNRVGRWISFAAACRPFGLVALSPDTRLEGDWGCGYNLADNEILGLSHIHDWQGGGILMMPVSGAVELDAGPAAFKSRFSRDTEHCKPGDHRFRLEDHGVDVELTATARVGVHRYTFPGGCDAGVVIDLVSQCGPCEMSGGRLVRTGRRSLQGQVVNGPTRRKPRPHTVYFAIELDHDAELEVSAAGSGRARLSLGRPAGPVTLKVGVSYTSVEAAVENLQAEAAGKAFDALRAEARAEWNALLGRIEVAGGEEERIPRFYTDLYFALLGRRTVSDVAGTYCDNTGPAPVVRRIPAGPDGRPAYRHFSSDAFWGAQWSLTPLWALVYPEIVDEFCRCFMDMARNGGLIPRGPAGGNDTFVMTSAQTTPLFACALNNGLYQPEDTEEVYRALRKNHFPGGLMGKAGYEHDSAVAGGIEDYISLGYIPEDLPKAGFHANGAAQTIEHAYNDWALARVAESLGKADDAALFDRRSKNYAHLFDPAAGFCRPRERDGSWTEPFEPFQKKGWTEANAWTFTFHAPHDVAGMIAMFGSREAFFARLEEAFRISEEMRFFAPRDEHNLIPLDFGNEPALATAHLFHLAGRPERAQYWLRRVLDTLKSGNTPDDWWGGDEDQGIMGAWNVLVSIGLFAATGACERRGRYQVTMPVFDRVTLRLHPRYATGAGFDIRVLARGASGAEPVRSASLNGEPLAGPSHELTHDHIAAGGVLLLSSAGQEL